MEIILITLILFILYREFVAKKSLKKLNILLKENLGKPESLQGAYSKLGSTEGILILNSFVPIEKYSNKESIWSRHMVGYGLISNPDKPYSPVFAEILFRWDEQILPGKEYRLRQEQNGIDYLSLV